MPARFALVLMLALPLAALIPVTSASGAPIARTTSLISQPTGLPDPDSDDVTLRSASTDGSVVVLETDQQLTADDQDSGRTDLYARANGVTTLLSGPTGVADPDTAGLDFCAASTDGTRVFFETTQKLTSDDADTNRPDVYEHSGGTTKLVSAPTGVADPDNSQAEFEGITPDGGHVFFNTGQKMTTDDGDANFLDLYQRSGGATSLVSAPTGVPDPSSGGPSFGGVSVDGSRVFFNTQEKLTADDGDSNRQDVYERSGGTTSLVSKPTGVADPDSGHVNFEGASHDGTRVFVSTGQKLTADDGDSDQFDVYQRSGGTTTLVSAPTGVADPDSDSVLLRGISADGTRVFFDTAQKLTADDLDTDRTDIYQRAGGTTTLLSGPTGVADPDTSTVDFSGASADGSRVFFVTSQKLTAGDGDTSFNDVYERSAGATQLLSAPTGVADPDSNDVDFEGASSDGTRVFMETEQKLTADDGDSDRGDVYERHGGVTGLISKPTGVAEPDNGGAGFEGASVDGRRVFFDSSEKLTTDDADSLLSDVFMAADTAAPQTTITSGPSGATGDATPTFAFSSGDADATFQCRVDGGAFAACSSPFTSGTLAPGAHSFEVRAVDNAGNVDASPATRAFTVAAAAGPGGSFSPVGADATAPRARLSGKRTQKLGSSIAVTVACLNEACKVAATASVSVPAGGAAKRFSLKRAAKSIRRGGKTTLKLKLSRKARKAIKRALRKRRKVSAKVRITVTDASGNTRVLRRSVRLALSARRS